LDSTLVSRPLPKAKGEAVSDALTVPSTAKSTRDGVVLETVTCQGIEPETVEPLSGDWVVTTAAERTREALASFESL
jgi:hypothetical protein